jgi:hypothetical protein
MDKEIGRRRVDGRLLGIIRSVQHDASNEVGLTGKWAG